VRLLALALVACSSPAAAPTPPRPLHQLAALPPQQPIDTEHFTGVVVCVRCHTAGDTAMRDAAGRDISPVIDTQSSMMALSARDPYFLAALRRELVANPAGKATIEPLCLRCHAPVGFAESPAIGLADVEAATTPVAVLARDGVGCLGCHALAPDGLGEPETFTGRAALRTDRVTFGALAAPLGEAMVTMSKTTPIHAAHVTESLLCASCHTVIVRALDASGSPTGDELAEQATFLEWRDSDFAPSMRIDQPCQSCHMPAGADTPFSTRPPDAPSRPGYRRHTLRGGNAYLLERLSHATDWLDAPAHADELAAAAADTREFLRTAAKLEVTHAHAAGEWHVVVKNLTGHKLPTGFPTRRMWLHVVGKDVRGRVVFESGGTRDGALVDGTGKRLDPAGTLLPHRNRIAAGDQVAMWEAVPVDARGAPTHLLLGAARFGKDDRILPAGWRADRPDAARTHAIGVDGDTEFRPGEAGVTVVVPASTATVTFELDYQSIPPETIESYDVRHPEAARFVGLVAVRPVPEVLASVTQAAQ